MKWFRTTTFLVVVFANAVSVSSMLSENISFRTNNTSRKPMDFKTGHDSYKSEKEEQENNGTSTKRLVLYTSQITVYCYA